MFDRSPPPAVSSPARAPAGSRSWRRVPAAAALLLAGGLATGCKDVEGIWLGECAFDHETYNYLALVALDITDGKGANVDGKIVFDLSDGRNFKGRQEGLRSDTYFETEGVLVDEEGRSPYTVTLAGEVEEFETITGECSFAVPGGTGRLIGDLKLERIEGAAPDIEF